MRTTSLIVILVALILGLFIKFWPRSCLCHIRQRLDGKVALVTDGPSFMGKELIVELARRGATVLVGCQNSKAFDDLIAQILRLYGEKGERATLDFADEQVKQDLKPIELSQIIYMPAHLNSLKEVKTFAKNVMAKTKRLDFLINNAAVGHGPYGTTVDGYESSMAIGHLAHYLLTNELKPLLLKTKPGARIINIASAEHSIGSFETRGFFIDRRGFDSVKALSQVKLANVIHAVILADQFKETSVVPLSVHPGYVLPDFGLFIPSFISMFFKSHWEAGQAVLYTLLAPDVKPGGYYDNCVLTEPAPEAQDAKIIKFVKEETEKYIKQKL